uniref:Uncharacterized protein n=1 Tax=Oryza rufipogon TaxID=4529 RepID=A0A0E0RDH2_ORYRU
MPAGAWRSTSSGGRHGRGQGRGWRVGMGLWESSRSRRGINVERGETRQRSRPGVARRHGTMGELEVKTGHDDSGD